MKKVIIRSDALPQHLQSELEALQTALDKRYGVAARIVGSTMENLTTLCTMVRGAGDMTDAERIAAYDRSRDVCADVLSMLARLLDVDRDAAIAVARAYQDYSQRIEEELLGAEILDSTKAQATEVINKASIH